ncbi:class I SAM-dependent methyltransferase [Caulobacter soli]|uniref:class I SAM-dependent methyltransferase n=1 Tax=Caulobacter soli TaxID=2708539 RepID=UPI0013ED9AEA|nr:class I SAM-dependent methyltransferase [Caulobacter soli]
MTRQDTRTAMTASFWNAEGGEVWVRSQDLLDRLNAPIGEAVVARADPGPGKRVLDVGCGAGATTLDMARRLGPAGSCVGVDVSGPLLNLARQRAEAQDLPQAQFIEADAQDHAFEAGAFDAILSRFGVMFFPDPDAAFANLRRALKPGGALVFACWRGPAENPLSQIPLQVAAPLLSEPPPPPGDGPGRFAFADPDRVRGVLDRSGWRDIAITPLDAPMPLSFDELMVLSLELGSLGPILRREDEATRARVTDAVAERLRDEVRDGVVPMTGACWLVTAVG